MHRSGLAIGIVLLVSGLVYSDISMPRYERVPVGARGLAMAGNMTAVANDFTALYYNPGALGTIPAREFQFSLNGYAQNVVAGGLGAAAQNASKGRIKPSTLGLLWAVPVKQGGLAFAVGYTSPFLFDNTYEYRKTTSAIAENARFNAYGQVSLWSFGLGVQAAPGLSFGAAASLAVGSSEVTAARLPAQSVARVDSSYYYFQTRLTRRYVGYDLSGGVLYTPLNMLSVGLKLTLPRYIRFTGDIEESNPYVPSNWESTTSQSDPGYLRTNIEGSLGAAVRLPFMTLAPSACFRAPDPSDTTKSDASHWKGGAGIGVEIPISRLLLRAGYSWYSYDQQPANVTYDFQGGAEAESPSVVDRNQNTVSGGIAFLSKGTMSFDISYAYRFWELTDSRGLNQKHGFHQASTGIQFRF